MKNIFQLILSLAFAASLTACGDGTKSETKTADGKPASTAKEDAALLDNARITKLNLYINFGAEVDKEIKHHTRASMF